MNEDRIVGAGRDMLGGAESRIGDATGSDRLKGDGVIDQVAGAVQHGYGVIKDSVADVAREVPVAVGRGRELGQRGDDFFRDRLGSNAPFYLLGGAVALLALGAFAFRNKAPAGGGRARSAPKSHVSKRASTTS